MPLFVEPIYPDLSNPINQIPTRLLDELIEKIDVDQLEPEGNMNYVIPKEIIEEEFGEQFRNFFGLNEDLQDHILDIDLISEEHYEKPSSIGKPENNKDPYPTDGKVWELQEHHPRVKIEPSPGTCGTAVSLSRNVESRLVHIENIVSKTLHYLYRMASRIKINCVYYGGQSEYNKYKCIRCLHDDRINDGQIMTLDQCLNCTRYEPIEGKCYEIPNEQGHNINLIQDDNQMGYTSMEDKFDLIRNEYFREQNKKTEIASFDLDSIENPKEDYSFNWDDGFIMNWDETELNSQNPDVHFWGCSEPSTRQRSGGIVGRTGYRPPINFETIQAVQDEAVSALEHLDENIANAANSQCNRYAGKLPGYWRTSKEEALNSRVLPTIENMKKYGFEDAISELSMEYGVDPSLVLAIICTESMGRVGVTNSYGYTGLMQVPRGNLPDNWDTASSIQKAYMEIKAGIEVYLQKRAYFGSNTNMMLEIVAYNAGEGMIGGTQDGRVGHIADMSTDLDRSNMKNWTWDIAGPCIVQNAVTYYGEWKDPEVGTFYPRVINAYREIVNYEGSGIFDVTNSGIVFPVPEEYLIHCVFTSAFGRRILNGEVNIHHGIDIGTRGRKDVPALSMAPGRVIIANFHSSAGYRVVINHGHMNGNQEVFSCYYHLKRGSFMVREGDEVAAGQQVGIIGNTGHSFGEHLHFEIRHGGNFQRNAVNPAANPYFIQLSPYDRRNGSFTSTPFSRIIEEQGGMGIVVDRNHPSLEGIDIQ